MRDIFNDGTIEDQDARRTIYLTSSTPHTFYKNTWVYHEMPDFETWKRDCAEQQRVHQQQGSSHLSFTFPENCELGDTWQDELKQEGFQLGILELYAVEPDTFLELNPAQKKVQLAQVDHETLEDYIEVYREFSEPFGREYTEESIWELRENYEEEPPSRFVAYFNQQPVGIVDVIFTNSTVELDGFGVLESYQRQGIGRAIQREIARLAEGRTMILVADGEDTAKDMYVKQGYVFLSYTYQALKESMDE
ncbi:GNAT family N-acetyltransferase [Staphylococcus argensis]|uniref:GNAT family N-acetyltransferase n=2 Tax=Staphylococcus argensis TaxID=1607738 RepID=A0A2K4FCN7_9STAP|nr:GNAT family N-acetyltransferase [Staphylococcus argensis]